MVLEKSYRQCRVSNPFRQLCHQYSLPESTSAEKDLGGTSIKSLGFDSSSSTIKAR